MLRLEPLVDRLMPLVPTMVDCAGAPMEMVLPLVVMLSPPVADRLDCAGTDMVSVELLVPLRVRAPAALKLTPEVYVVPPAVTCPPPPPPPPLVACMLTVAPLLLVLWLSVMLLPATRYKPLLTVPVVPR